MSKTTHTDDQDQHGAAETTDDEPIQIGSEWPRRGGIRITLSDEPSEDDLYREVNPLAGYVRSALDKQGLDRVEVLSWPGDDHQEWVIFPGSTTTATKDADSLGKVTGQSTLDNYGHVSGDRDEQSSLTGSLESVCDDHPLFDIAGYDICDVDFAPTESAIRPTSRLVVRSSPDFYPLIRKQPHPIADLITDLNQDELPYLLQTIVSVGNNSDYEVSQRLAVYPPQYGIGVEGDFAQLLNDGPVVNLSDYYDPAQNMVLTNFDINGHDFFRVRGTGPDATVEPRHNRGEAAAERARRILKGKYECYKLYVGYHDTDQTLKSLYRAQNHYTKLPVDSAALDAFLAFVPDYFEDSPWKTVGYADPPSLITRPKQLPADGPPAEASSQETADASSTTGPGSGVVFVTQGSEEHQFSERRVKDYHENRGFRVIRPDTESSDSVPDLILIKDGTVYFAEVERSGTSQPANILINAARAAYYGVPVYFFVENKSAARSVARVLRDPVKTHTESGALLYTQSKALTLEDGGKPVLPADAESTSKWYIVNDDPDPGTTARLELRATGDILASGPVDESVATWDFDTEVIPSSQSIPDDKTRIHPGFVPTKLAYLTQTAIRYQRDINEFALFERDDYEPGWDYTDSEGKRKRYTAAFGKFVDSKTIPVEGADLLRDEVLSTFIEDLYKPQTSRKAPGQGQKGEASRALWKHADSKKNNTDGSGKVVKVRDRTWRWPRGIESPDLPFVGGEPLLEEWV